MSPTSWGEYRQGYFGPRAGSLSLTEDQPAWTEPFTVGEIQKFLNLPERNPPDLAEEDLLQSFIQAAREFAEIAQGRDLVRKQWDLLIYPGDEVSLRSPLASVDLVQRRIAGSSTDLAEGTDYRVDLVRSRVYLSYNAGAGVWAADEELLVRFTSGYLPGSIFWSDAGARIKTGMRLLISEWFYNRIPFGEGAGPGELPYAVTSCLSHGSIVRLP
jgi:uncharacterized phiE125 gp8 family phage protein